MPADQWLRRRFADLARRVEELEAWRGGAVVPEQEIEPVAVPPGYLRLSELGVDRARECDWSDPAINIYLPDWEQGPLSVADPSLLEWREDGSVVIRAMAGPARKGRSWHTGALQFNRPKLARGRAGAVIHVTDPAAVCAFFGHDSKTRKEIDFELTLADGVAGYVPAVHMPRSDGSMSHSGGRRIARALWADRPQVLEYDLQPDRCDFFCDGVRFETILPADMDDPSAWDVTTGMAQHCAIEKHTGWAGWDYASGRAQMVVHALKVAPEAVRA